MPWLLLALVAMRPATITVRLPAMPLAAALKAISTQAGQELTATPDQGKLMVLLSVKEASPDELRSKIAKVTCGKWKQMTGGWKLVFDADEAAARLAKTQAVEAAFYAREQKRLLAGVPEKFGPAEAQTLLSKLAVLDEGPKGPGGVYTGDVMGWTSETPSYRCVCSLRWPRKFLGGFRRV